MGLLSPRARVPWLEFEAPKKAPAALVPLFPLPPSPESAAAARRNGSTTAATAAPRREEEEDAGDAPDARREGEAAEAGREGEAAAGRGGGSEEGDDDGRSSTLMAVLHHLRGLSRALLPSAFSLSKNRQAGRERKTRCASSPAVWIERCA